MGELYSCPSDSRRAASDQDSLAGQPLELKVMILICSHVVLLSGDTRDLSGSVRSRRDLRCAAQG